MCIIGYTFNSCQLHLITTCCGDNKDEICMGLVSVLKKFYKVLSPTPKTLHQESDCHAKILLFLITATVQLFLI